MHKYFYAGFWSKHKNFGLCNCNAFFLVKRYFRLIFAYKKVVHVKIHAMSDKRHKPAPRL